MNLKSKVNLHRVVISIGAVFPATVLVLALNAPGSNVPVKVKSQPFHEEITAGRRNIGTRSDFVRKPWVHEVPMVHDLTKLAISLAESL